MAKRRPNDMTEYQNDIMSKRKNPDDEKSLDDGQNSLGQTGQNDGQSDHRQSRRNTRRTSDKIDQK